MTSSPVRRRLVAAALLAATLPFAAPPGASAAEPATTVLYEVERLPTLGGRLTFPRWINDHGVVTGESSRHGGRPDPTGVAFVYRDGRMKGVLDPYRPSAGVGLSDDDVLLVDAGFASYLIDRSQARTPIGLIWPSTMGPDGTVYGTDLGGDASRAVKRAPDGTLTPVFTQPGYDRTWARAMSRGGDVTLNALVAGTPGTWHAWAVLGGVPQRVMVGDADVTPVALNDAGLVTGVSQRTVFEDVEGFVWQAGVARSLEAPALGYRQVWPNAVNAHGVVVGQMHVDRAGERTRRHAFVWRDGTLTDLNDLLGPGHEHFVLKEATAINDRGEIVGIGELDRRRVAFIARPVTR